MVTQVLFFLARLIYVAAWARAGWFHASSGFVSAEQLIFTLGASAVLTRFWLVKTYLDPGRAVLGTMPSWFESPAQLEQPFQYFHLCAWSFIAFSAFSVLATDPAPPGDLSTGFPTDCFPGAMGLGVLLGIAWAVRAHPDKFVQQGSSGQEPR